MKCLSNQPIAIPFCCLLIAFFLISPSAADNLILDINDPAAQVEAATIGNDLWIQIYGGSPFEALNIALKDEANHIVQCTAVITNANGSAKPFLLWKGSGVIGAKAELDPGPYDFEDYTEAEATLKGRSLSIEIQNLDSCSPPTSFDIDMKVDESSPRFYIADGSGLPMFERSATDSLYLAANRLPTSLTELRVWVIDPDAEPDPATGATGWVDLRSQYPSGQVISLLPGSATTGLPSSDLLTLIWAAPAEQDFKIIVRASHGGTTNSNGTPLVGDTDLASPNMGPCHSCVPDDPEGCLECAL